MRTYYLEMRLQASGDLEHLEMHLDEILQELEQLGGVTDADWGAALARGLVYFTGYLEADGLRDAHARFDTAIRTAVHAAGGHTPGWEFVPRSIGVTEQDALAEA